MDEQLRATFKDLLDRAERYIREHDTGKDQEWYLSNLPCYRRATDFPVLDMLRGFEKFLWHAWSYASHRGRLCAELEPYVAMARAARDRLGGPSLLDDLP
jgi:uncharacterized protein (DUF2461 family)